MLINRVIHKEVIEEQDSLIDTYFYGEFDKQYLESMTEEDLEKVEGVRNARQKEYEKSITRRGNLRRPKYYQWHNQNEVYEYLKDIQEGNVLETFKEMRGDTESRYGRYRNGVPQYNGRTTELEDFANKNESSEKYYVKVNYIGSATYIGEGVGTVRYLVYNKETGLSGVLYQEADKVILNYPEMQKLDYIGTKSRVNKYLVDRGYGSRYKLYDYDISQLGRINKTPERVISHIEKEGIVKYLVYGYYTNLFSDLEEVYLDYKTKRNKVPTNFDKEGKECLKIASNLIKKLEKMKELRLKTRTHNLGQYKYYDKRNRGRGRRILNGLKEEYNYLGQYDSPKREDNISNILLDKSQLLTKEDNYIEWD